LGLREAKKDELRRRLYETAAELFRQRGFTATRIKDVIDAVGVSEATFFNYFPSKEAVLHHSAAQTKDLYGLYLQHLCARADEPATDRLTELTGVMASVCVADREFMATVVQRTSLFTDATGDDKAKDLANFELLAELFWQGQQHGEIEMAHNPTQLAEMFIAIHTLTITNWLTGWWGDIGELEPRMVAALRVLLNGARTTVA
jgi:AcrR family transcriptional regulator